ncbi:hypothetical protein LY76DRAFT_262437 [Colletotrichum caudatum]|nr:hypothetical protein LY76DRAFT_262437 [Colletotrichum caudatum]
MRASFLILSVGLSWSQLSPMALGDYCFEIALRTTFIPIIHLPLLATTGVEGQRKRCDCAAHRGRWCDRAQVGARSLQLSTSGHSLVYFVLNGYRSPNDASNA